MHLKTKFKILEFIIFGIIAGIIENSISVYVLGGQLLDMREFFILFLIVTPFAVVEEFVVDHPTFWLRVCKVCGIRIDKRDLQEK